MRLTDKEKRKPLELKHIQKVMANPNTIREKENVKVTSTKPDNITSQIEEFFKAGKSIEKIDNNKRALPYWTWFLEDYPTRKYRR
tara:strand:- start:702 stop:956 length:255 start_codon:yes stop_codon:yes gene_type:complete